MRPSLTLKKLTIKCIVYFDFWDISFDTPSLAYLEYRDVVPKYFPIVNLESLVEAKLDLRIFSGYSNPTNLLKGLINVKVLVLSSVDTWKIFCNLREAIPVFSNLLRLTITIDRPYYDWEFLPILVKRSPNLQTIIIKGPLKADKCDREYGLSCPVKVLKICEYGGKIGELEQMKHFLEKLTCLELVKLRLYAVNEKEKSRIIKDLQRVPRSSKCKFQIMFCEKQYPY